MPNSGRERTIARLNREWRNREAVNAIGSRVEFMDEAYGKRLFDLQAMIEAVEGAAIKKCEEFQVKIERLQERLDEHERRIRKVEDRYPSNAGWGGYNG